MIKKIIISLALVGVLFSFSVVQAQKDKVVDNTKQSASEQKGQADNTNKTVKLDNPLGEGVTITTLIGKIINAILGVVGSLALLMFVYGGLVWMTSSGNSEKIKSGRDTIVWSAIGLIIVFASYGLVRFLILSVKG